MRLDGLLGEEEANPDLAVHQAVGDELEHLDLAVRRLLLELPEGPVERDDLTGGTGPATGGHLVEPTGVIRVAAQDLMALCCIHASYIGAAYGPL